MMSTIWCGLLMKASSNSGHGLDDVILPAVRSNTGHRRIVVPVGLDADLLLAKLGGIQADLDVARLHVLAKPESPARQNRLSGSG